jgi:four helix bundle protein
MKEELLNRTKQFAINIFKELDNVDHKFIDYKRQLIRSSSSVGANYRAACVLNHLKTLLTN